MMREDYVMNPVSAHKPMRGLLSQTVQLTLAAAIMGTLLSLAPLGFQHAYGAEQTHLRVSSLGTTQVVSLDVNKSMLIDLPVDVKEVIVSQPGVANAILRNKRRAIVQAVGAGESNIFFMDANGRTIVVLDVSTKGSNIQSANIAAVLRDTFAKVIPKAKIDVEAVAVTGVDGAILNRIVLSGDANSADEAHKAMAIAAQFAGGPDNVTSVLNIEGSQQVMLKVTVAEVNRSLAKQFGIDLSGSFSSGGLTTSFVSDQPLGGASNLFSNSRIGGSVTAGPFTIDAQLRAMEQRGASRTLAEPVLTAISGQPATFTAGGQFPVPTGVKDDTVSFAYQDFGVTLAFTPTIKSDGMIGLEVDTASSELSPEGSITVGAITLPGIKKREAKTSVEIRAGETLAIGGLIQDTTRAQVHRLPGLGDIPILGTLFRSRDFIRSQTEMVILVTPYLAQATREVPELPTDRMVFANDAEAIFLGRIETMYGVGPAGTRGSYDGAVGFVLD
ncbi:type II and III secretion system protein family protein [Devosia sp. ZB163]|uniref:type II and III secretion system protein family protein n=1 Tax=Devosia sp. ZB163 TaxID=3025938 RepID=UPI00235EBF5E|nr:type II and III secretion system protein family protein [Devosia sp. ZB163]MDC9823226.1 type II and III secretion system protein family protein [Devosia sp. ZB163]